MFDFDNCTETSSSSRGIKYHFKCDNPSCDVVIKITKADSKNRKSAMCKKCSNLKKLEYSRSNFVSSKLRPYEALYNNFLKQCRRKKLNNSISFEDFLNFTEIKFCEYCESKITWSERNLKENGYSYNLDRKDSKVGYSVDNTSVCCWRCNDIKSNKFSHEDFLLIGEVLKKIDAKNNA
jgi:hypothetical protein